MAISLWAPLVSSCDSVFSGSMEVLPLLRCLLCSSFFENWFSDEKIYRRPPKYPFAPVDMGTGNGDDLVPRSQAVLTLLSRYEGGDVCSRVQQSESCGKFWVRTFLFWKTTEFPFDRLVQKTAKMFPFKENKVFSRSVGICLSPGLVRTSQGLSWVGKHVWCQTVWWGVRSGISGPVT